MCLENWIKLHQNEFSEKYSKHVLTTEITAPDLK